MTGPRRDPTGRHLRTLLAGRNGPAAQRQGILEGLGAEGTTVGARDVAARVKDILQRMPVDDVGDQREFEQALQTMIEATTRAVRALDRRTMLSPGDLSALEAVVLTDGSRPSLLVRDDTFDPNYPLAGDWTTSLKSVHVQAGEIAKSVGRIEPDHGTARNYFGTGWVVDAAEGLVLTNLHVLEKIWQTLPDAVVRTGSSYRILDGVQVDFARESGRTRAHRFRVVEATPSGIDGSRYARLDAAVLRLEPVEGQVIPPAVPIRPDVNGPQGNLDAVYLLGFPGPPISTAGKDNHGVDWAEIYRVLFGNVYGVKRLAPGTVHEPLGSRDDDPRGWVFGHDATTLGGNSGSPVLAVVEDTLSAIGLHFAGASQSGNDAHAFSAAAEALKAIGVPVDPAV